MRRYATEKPTITVDHVVTRDGRWRLPVTIISPPNVAQNNHQPFLFISGWSGISSDWGALPKLVASRTNQEVVLYDPRWLGDAEQLCHDTEEQLSWKTMANDVVDVLNHVKETRYHLHPVKCCVVGASMGGAVTQWIVSETTEKLPIKVQGMVLISTIKAGKSKYGISQDFLSIFDTWGDGSENEAALNFFTALGSDFLAMPGRLKLRDRLIKHFVASRNEVGIHAQRSVISDDLSIQKTNLANLKSIPTMVMHGQKDQVIDYRTALELQDALGASCHIELFHNSDHLLWITDGMRIVDDITHFYLQLQDK